MKENENSRRRFLSKLLAGTTVAVAAPVLGSFRSENDALEKKEDMKAIKKVRALGFQWETLDPFLFCVHHEDKYPRGNGKMGPLASLEGRNLGQDFNIKDGWRMYHGEKIPGFPGHPHRGFETLTVVRKGLVDHADSAGGAGRYGNGDLQWMTAGKGLMHSEMFPLLSDTDENPLELFQIWLNLPRAKKMASPDYKMFWSEDISKFDYSKDVYVEVLVGELFGKTSPTPPKDSWAYEKENHVGVFNIQLAPNAEFTLPAIEAGINRTIYFYEGNDLDIEGDEIPGYHAVDVLSEKDVLIKNGGGMSKILVLQGRPINEPVVQHGPFVMNSRQEIQEAFQDYQKGSFGGWPWPSYDHVHEKSLGRFAQYSDGSEEKKS